MGLEGADNSCIKESIATAGTTVVDSFFQFIQVLTQGGQLCPHGLDLLRTQPATPLSKVGLEAIHTTLDERDILP